MRVAHALLVCLIVLPACASGGGSSTSTGRQRNLITSEEIQPLQVASAYEVVQQLRPEYLRTRGARGMAGQPETAVVYVDGVRQGGTGYLRQIPKETVMEVRYMNANDATTMYGTGHSGGAIIVRTRR